MFGNRERASESNGKDRYHPEKRKMRRSVPVWVSFGSTERTQRKENGKKTDGEKKEKRRRGERRNTTWGLGSGYHATDKAR